MAPILAPFLALLATLGAVFYQLVASRFIHVGGAFRKADPLNNAQCKRVDDVFGCEEFTIHPYTGLVYLACSSETSRARWDSFFTKFDEPSLDDYVAIYDPSTSTIKRLKLEGFTEPRKINVHGFHLVPARDKPETEAYVYMVNHRPQPGPDGVEKTKQLGMDDSIEVFKTAIGSDVLHYVGTFENPDVILAANDLVGSDTGDEVYFTNDHGVKVGYKRDVQKLLNQATTSVGYCSIKDGCKFAATDLKSANGITRLGDTIYVTDNSGGLVNVFERQADNTLVLTDTIQVGRTLDNLNVDREGNIYAAAFVNVVSLVRHAHNASIPCASSAYKITLNDGPGKFFGEKYKVERIFEDDGLLASCSTNVIGDPDRKKLYLSGVNSLGLVECDLAG